ncbi:hypothetical protein AMTRI_Chr09g40780 [Amborella trichopoda]
MRMYRLWLVVGVVVVVGAMVEEAAADTMVSGTVFCDACKDGQRSSFDYPLSGAKVAVACAGNDGQVTVWKEESTNWFGNYGMRFEGSPDLSRCFAQVVANPQGSNCGIAGGPARGLNLVFDMFGMEMYVVDSLLSQPSQPMAFCPKSNTPSPPSLPSPPSPPTMHPMPFFQASACSSEYWLMPEYRCYWKVVGPGTKVAVAFGPAAAQKYGTDLPLYEALQGRGDLYRTLLREATTALLNSYNSLQFGYPTLTVVGNMNWALQASPQEALRQAMRFKRANAGTPETPCRFTPCN